ncbi:hypothetical protein [Bremerella sp. P1]|nr:hypothetical protein [Bremerella sp. P1]WDI41044.1 hypothetical protein PSR63_21480 [Bremerella sp. P1]
MPDALAGASGVWPTVYETICGNFPDEGKETAGLNVVDRDNVDRGNR